MKHSSPVRHVVKQHERKVDKKKKTVVHRHLRGHGVKKTRAGVSAIAPLHVVPRAAPSPDSFSNHIYFENDVQAVLYAAEMSGQISDGMWENAKPFNHWEKMSGAGVFVDSNNPHMDFVPRRHYNFADSELVDIVGDRMKRYITILGEYPHLRNELIYGDANDVDLESIGRFINSGDKYWKEKIAKAKRLYGVRTNAELLRVAGEIEYKARCYPDSLLKHELSNMSRIVNRSRAPRLEPPEREPPSWAVPQRESRPVRSEATRTEYGYRRPTEEESAHEQMRISNALRKDNYEQVLRLRMDRITHPQKMWNFYLALENENIHDLAAIARTRALNMPH